jgi:cytochrome c biogenesis protein CcdA
MLTIVKIITLAATNALNPCAFAVLTMVLFSIMAANPEKKHKVLVGGLYFSAAIFLGYFFYGLVIAQIFKSFLSFATIIYPYVSNTLAALAIVIGMLNIKDFIRYQPGGIATEMPLILRPLSKLYIKRITSPGGAFIIGLFVTLFLLPCTIAPYIIAFGGMTELSLLQTIPWLILYNLIFVLPMIIVTLIVYFGVNEIEKLTSWKEKNIKYIHLIMGLLLVGLGIAIITKII